MKKEIPYYNYIKAILVIGMICGHAIMLLSESKTGLFYWFKTYINLVTFSGFVFVFAQLQDIQEANVHRKVTRELSSILKLLIAFYISGLFYRLLVTHHQLNKDLILNILVLKDIPGYSEFLLAFALFTFIFSMIKRFLSTIWKNNWFFIIILCISIASSLLIKRGSDISWIGLLIGSHKFGAFPIQQYAFYYSLGILFHRNIITINRLTLLISIICSSSFIIFFLTKNHIPGRFPPTIFWILGAMFPILIKSVISINISKKQKFQSSFISTYLQLVGKNTLFHLLLSNILLFCLSNYLHLSRFSALLFGIFIIMINQYLIKLIRN